MNKPAAQAPVFTRDSNTCEHFFVFGEKKETESCSGTHYTHCKFCGKNPHKHASDLFWDLHSKGIISPRMDEREKEKLTHVHVWEPVKGKPHTYRCHLNVTDWKNSKKNYYLRIPCGELITVKH